MTGNREDLGPVIDMDMVRVTSQSLTSEQDRIATEIPLTILANDSELATLLTSPSNLYELTCGYLYTSGYITKVDEVKNYILDKHRWTVGVQLARMPEPALMQKRLYTSGCGRCAMYTTINEISLRKKLVNPLCINRDDVFAAAERIEKGTPLFDETGSLHCSLLIDQSSGAEIIMDDVARHNSLDKAIGKALLEGTDLSRCILARTGRTSSEMLYKVRRCGIPISIARGAPTHQAVHLARETGITLIGFARPDGFNIYSCSERIVV